MSNDYESDDKMVSHPSHYTLKDESQVADHIEILIDDLKGAEALYTGKIIKYAARWKKKNGAQDLEKIIWYATRLKNIIDNK